MKLETNFKSSIVSVLCWLSLQYSFWHSKNKTRPHIKFYQFSEEKTGPNAEAYNFTYTFLKIQGAYHETGHTNVTLVSKEICSSFDLLMNFNPLARFEDGILVIKLLSRGAVRDPTPRKMNTLRRSNFADIESHFPVLSDHTHVQNID